MINTLPLDSFRNVISYNPFHFWGLTNDLVPITSKCNTIVSEYAWQTSDAAGRDNIRESIASAESILRNHLKFNVGVHYVESVVNYPKLRDPSMIRYAAVDPRGQRLALQMPEGMIIDTGIETRLVIDPAAAVVITDQFGDGVNDTFTLTVDITGVDVESDEIAVYFAAADRFDGMPVSEKWRVAPVNISISGNIATITGRVWLIVKPVLYQGVVVQQIDPNDANNFVNELLVVKRYANSNGTTIDTAEAVLIWETNPSNICAGSSGCFMACDGLSFESGYADPHAEAYAIARVGKRDAELGWLHVGESVYNVDGTWQEISFSGCTPPNRVLVRYKSGIDYDNVNMLQNGANWRLIVSRLAAAELMQRICACDIANQELYRWQFDVSRSAGANDEQYTISDEDLNNPLGLTRLGAIYAWKQIKLLRQVRTYSF